MDESCALQHQAAPCSQHMIPRVAMCVCSLVDVLAPMERTGIDSGCISQMLNSQLARLAQLNAQVLLVLPHADMLFADEEAAKAVNGRLISMLAAVPLMKIVLTMTRHADAVAPVFGKSLKGNISRDCLSRAQPRLKPFHHAYSHHQAWAVASN